MSLYDSATQQNHTLFFGGMSNYYYANNQLIKDDNVPFVKTISRLSRYKNDSLAEYVLPNEMPYFSGASAEFIPNLKLKNIHNEIIRLDRLGNDSTLIGYIYGCINSSTLNPFTNNETSKTSADNTIYAVYLNKQLSGLMDNPKIDGKHPFSFKVSPNPNQGKLHIQFTLYQKPSKPMKYYLISQDGKILTSGEINSVDKGLNEKMIGINNIQKGLFFLNIVLEDKFNFARQIIFE